MFTLKHCCRAQMKLRQDVVHNLTRTTAWEAVMRIRCSKGLRISAFHGHFFIRSSDLLALPQVPDTPTLCCSVLTPCPVTAAGALLSLKKAWPPWVWHVWPWLGFLQTGSLEHNQV